MIKIVLCFFILSVIPLSNNLLIAQSDVIKVRGGLIEEGVINAADKKYAAHPFAVPHEIYLIYDAQPGKGHADLFISFREKNLT